MLYFFTTFAIDVFLHSMCFDVYCVLVIPALRAIEAAFPVLQNHLAEIRNVTSSASVQAFIPPSTVRFAPAMYEDSGPATNATSCLTRLRRRRTSGSPKFFSDNVLVREPFTKQVRL